MLDNHLLVEVELIDPFNRSSEKTGTRVPIEDKKFKRGYSAFSISIPQGQSRTYFLGLKSSDQIGTNVALYTPKALATRDYYYQIFYGVIYGINLGFLIYHLIVFFMTRETFYLHYCNYVLAALICSSYFNGHIDVFLFRIKDGWTDKAHYFGI